MYNHIMTESYLSIHRLSLVTRRAFPQQSLRHEEFRQQQLMLHVPGVALEMLKMPGVYPVNPWPETVGKNNDKPMGIS